MSEIPDGWTISSVNKLSKNGLFSDGDWVESKDQDSLGKNRLIQLADIGDGIFLNKSSRFLNDEQFSRLGCTELKEGDILIARMPEPLGRACLFHSREQKCATVVDVAIIRLNNVDNFWLMSAINAPAFRQEIIKNASGTTRTRISKSILGNIKIPLPPLSEQKKIAEILSSVDRNIEATEKLIAKLSELKEALMQELFTKGIGHTKFKDSPLGKIPEEWEVVRLGDISKINPRLEQKPTPDFKVSFVPMDAVSNDGRLTYAIVRKYSEVSKGFTYFQDYDVLFAKITPCMENGKGALVHGLMNHIGFGSTEFHVLRATQKTTSEFVYHLVNWKNFRIEAESNMTGSAGQRRVPTDFLKLYQMALPPLKEQKQIGSILSGNDSKIEKAKTRLEKLKDMKKGLMQDLLTGKIRV